MNELQLKELQRTTIIVNENFEIRRKIVKKTKKKNVEMSLDDTVNISTTVGC